MKQLVLLGALLLAACSPAATPEPTLTPAPTATPLEQFEAIVAEADLTFAAERAAHADYCAEVRVIRLSYDVRETSSLVSPFLGEINYAIGEHPGSEWATYTITESYVFQGGTWVLKETTMSDGYPAISNGLCKVVRSD